MPTTRCDCHTADATHAHWCRQVTFLTWPWRQMVKLDNTIGQRLDARLAGGMPRDLTGPVPAGPAEWALRLVSLLILALLAGLAGFGAWLIAKDFFFFPFALGGAVLIFLAYLLRPRLYRLKHALAGAYVLDDARYPAFFGLLRRIAESSGVGMPHFVAISDEWNASTAVVGLRRRRVLTIGLPLWVALRADERVAVLAHEFGHFAHEDSLRHLLAQPALTTFGRLARAIRPPSLAAVSESGAGFVILAWKLIGGTVFALLWAIHIGLNVAGYREARRAELRADLLSARTAGSRAATSAMEVMSGVAMLAPFVSADAETGRATQDWREAISAMRERKQEQLHELLRRSKQTDASLFASHPPPGVRHEFVAALPYFEPRIGLPEAEAERIDAELARIAEHMLAAMKRDRDWG